MEKGGSMAQRVFRRIEEDILNGKLAPGDTISELPLCAELRVSRTPVREALKRLSQEGLIVETPKGATVLGITEKDFNDIYAVRTRIEGYATALCADAIGDEELRDLAETLELQEFYVEKGQAENIRNMDSAFHEKIYAYCGSKILHTLLSDLHRKIRRFRRASVEDSTRARAAVREHREIYEALLTHNAARAEALAVQHIQNAHEATKKSGALTADTTINNINVK